MAEEKREDAITALSESSILPRSAVMLFMLGTLHFEEGNREEATTRLEEALALFPNFRDAHRNLAIVYVQQEEWENAQTHLIRAMELGSREAVTLGLLGYCHSVAGKHQAALDAYRIAALSQPEEKQWKLGQAQALLSLDEARKATQIYQEILEEEPADWNLWLTQADGWITLDLPIAAIANLDAARRAGQLSPDGTLSLGHLFLQNDLLDLAMQRYEEAFAIPDAIVPGKQIETLEYLTQLGRFSEAAQLLQQLPEERFASADSPSVEGRYQRVSSLLEIEIGDPEKGASQLEAWLKNNPIDGQALLLLAKYRESQGEREVAEMLYEQATGIPDEAAAAHRAWGNLLLAERDYEGAIEQWEQSLALRPSASLESSLEAVRELLP
jgi:tetratricopeptide (TPR) repeat protein